MPLIAWTKFHTKFHILTILKRIENAFTEKLK